MTETAAGFAQEKWWAAHRADPNTAIGNVPRAWELTGPLRSDLLADSLSVLAQRHEALRSCLAQRGDRLVQVIEPALTVDLPVVDLRMVEPSERLALAQSLVVDEISAPFDLTRAPLLRGRLLRLDEARHVLVVTVSHSIADRWSFGVLLSELFVVYGALSRGEPPQLEPVRQYREFTDWQNGWRENEELRRKFDQWVRYLSDVDPTLRLPVRKERSTVALDRVTMCPLILRPERWRRIAEVGRQERVPPYAVLMAALCVCLGPYASGGDLLFGMVHGTRRRPWTMGVVGLLVNDVWVRIHVGDNPTVRQLIERSWAEIRFAVRNGDFPSEEVARSLGMGDGPGQRPYWEAWMNLVSHETEVAPTLPREGLTVGDFPADLNAPFRDVVEQGWDKVLLRIRLGTARDEGAYGSIAFNAEILEGAVVEDLARRLCAVVDGLPGTLSSRMASLVTEPGPGAGA